MTPGPSTKTKPDLRPRPVPPYARSVATRPAFQTFLLLAPDTFSSGNHRQKAYEPSRAKCNCNGSFEQENPSRLNTSSQSLRLSSWNTQNAPTAPSSLQSKPY